MTVIMPLHNLTFGPACPLPASAATPGPFSWPQAQLAAPAGGWAGLRPLHLTWPRFPNCRGLGFLLSGGRKGLRPMLFTCGQFLFGF